MVSSPITCSSGRHWVSTPPGMKHPQHKKTAGTFRPLERGVQGQLLAQAVFALAQGGDAPADRRDMLTDVEVQAFHKGGVDLPATGRQHLLHRREGSEDHTRTDADKAPAPHG